MFTQLFTKRGMALLATLAIILVAVLLIPSTKKKSGIGEVYGLPPAAAISVATSFIQAREDMFGANQQTTASWLESIKQLTTSEFLNRLQPLTSSQTSSVPADFKTAHANGYIVKANVSDCIWNKDVATPTSAGGVVSCSVYDTTFSQSDQRPVANTSLPFGWSFNGQQSPAVIKLILQNGTWLVADDLTGQGS